MNWNAIYEHLNIYPNETLQIPVEQYPIEAPFGFHQTSLGFSENSIMQVRDNRRYNSLHTRIYENHIEVHMDKINPEYDPFGHLLADFPKIIDSSTIKTTILTGIAGLVIFKLLEKDE